MAGLSEQREPGARRRVDEPREEADRIQAELAVAEPEGQEWVIARRRVDAVPAPNGGDTADTEIAPDVRDADTRSAARDAVKPKPQVPVWPEEPPWSVLPVDYQRILKALTDRARLRQGPLTSQGMTAGFGMDVAPARAEALRSKAKRLVVRGWPAEPAPGRFTPAAGVSGPGGGS